MSTIKNFQPTFFRFLPRGKAAFLSDADYVGSYAHDHQTQHEYRQSHESQNADSAFI